MAARYKYEEVQMRLVIAFANGLLRQGNGDHGQSAKRAAICLAPLAKSKSDTMKMSGHYPVPAVQGASGDRK